jgi:hypothetical protein
MHDKIAALVKKVVRVLSFRSPSGRRDQMTAWIRRRECRARLATRPTPTGSPAVAKTMGMTDVACFAAIVAGVPPVSPGKFQRNLKI